MGKQVANGGLWDRTMHYIFYDSVFRYTDTAKNKYRYASFMNSNVNSFITISIIVTTYYKYFFTLL